MSQSPPCGVAAAHRAFSPTKHPPPGNFPRVLRPRETFKKLQKLATTLKNFKNHPHPSRFRSAMEFWPLLDRVVRQSSPAIFLIMVFAIVCDLCRFWSSHFETIQYSSWLKKEVLRNIQQVCKKMSTTSIMKTPSEAVGPSKNKKTGFKYQKTRQVDQTPPGVPKGMVADWRMNDE